MVLIVVMMGLKDDAGNESEGLIFSVTKQSNHALEFDGATKGQKSVADRLEIGELEGIAINPTDNFTVSFNIHFDSFSNDNPNLEDAWKNSQRGYQFIIGNYMGQPSGSGHFSSMLYELDGKLHFLFNKAQRRDKEVIFDFKTLNKDKLDYNIYASFDGTTAKIYIDGNEVADNYIGNIGGIANTAKWRAGNHYDGSLNGNRVTGDFALDGKLDNILFYNRALSSEEVNKIQNGGEVTTGIVAKYDFEGSNPLADKTGNGHDASITNTPTVVKW
ncbi:LamG-like jellyroll fold domain-containing protein [Candidatus Marithrix sp. Canyon 246]|uniref:LamG-like jellyroll fold domain-containing protein n=2 Tax=Candidatus Marithrix sp. Canyon 246 TaxID=1827136 RepID=UPI0009F5D080|nr:LamG-like jellyroll fold domain-containing protein [Candidatus Marithrix sp. Canyon 246]